MITIHKYHVPIKDELVFEMPAGAEILCVQMQNGHPFAWAKVDTVAPNVFRTFRWRGTGHDAAGLGRYVGTVQELEGALVWHLFEGARVEPEP